MAECIEEGCNNPRWSRKDKKCRNHTEYKSKSKIKKGVAKIKQATSKRVRENQLYSVMRRTFLEQNPRCAIFPALESTDVHHVHKRHGDRLLDTRYWMAVSREGHNYIHANPEEAYKQGWLKKG